MTDQSNDRQVILKALRLGVKTNSYTVLVPAQAQILKEILEDDSNLIDINIKLNGSCRACKYWNDPGRLASTSYCNRLVLTYDDIITPLEDADNSQEYKFAFTQQDFVCKYFVPKRSVRMQNVQLAQDTILPLPNAPISIN